MVKLDHLGVGARDPEGAARWLGEILGTEPPRPDGPDGDMFSLAIAGGVCLIFSRSDVVAPQHIAFRLDEASFLAAVSRLSAKGLSFGNDPEALTNMQTSDPLGGLGRAYFLDPDGHLFEICA